jgi:hypothetical protein
LGALVPRQKVTLGLEILPSFAVLVARVALEVALEPGSRFHYTFLEKNKSIIKYLVTDLDRRIEVLGADVSNKQYLLSLRRAAMALSPHFTRLDVASGWLATAKLARKSSLSNQAFNAILHATALGDESATIEHAKMRLNYANLDKIR